MGFGGTVDGFRLFIPDTLEHCTASDSCPTYEAGRLVEGGRFEIQALEVWARALQREVESETINKARSCDRAAFFGEFDQEMFLSKTMAHRSAGKR